MTKGFVLIVTGLMVCLALNAQTTTLQDFGHFQYNLNKRGVPHGNFSGITMIDDTTFAVVSDKDEEEGFHLWNIQWTDNIPTKIQDRYISAGISTSRDAEGIIYHPSTNTVFISAESDQRIKEYRMDGTLTGRELKIPDIFDKSRIQSNGGFESLAYNERQGLFWTCTELPLRGEEDIVRIQSFSEDMMPQRQFSYHLDADDKPRNCRMYLHGISAMTALDDGELLVLERMVAIKKNYWGSYCETKIYSITPDKAEEETRKTLLKQFKTCLNTRHWLGNVHFANYEGMCLGPYTSDGRQTLLLINDSQNGTKGLNEYIKILTIC